MRIGALPGGIGEPLTEIDPSRNFAGTRAGFSNAPDPDLSQTTRRFTILANAATGDKPRL